LEFERDRERRATSLGVKPENQGEKEVNSQEHGSFQPVRLPIDQGKGRDGDPGV